MTAREIVTANIEYRAETAIGLNFSGDRINDMQSVGIAHGFEPEKWEDGQYEYSTDIWGNTWHRLKHLSQGGEVCEPALSDWSDLDDLALPDLANPASYAAARDMGHDQACDGFRIGWMPGWPFSTARYLRKMEVYFVDLVTHRDHIDVLHDRLTTLFEGVITRYGEAGLDGVMFCEDLGVQDRLLMSPRMWRDVFGPLYERLTACAHRYGMKVIQHSCGYNWDLIDDLCAAGIDCLQFDQPAVYDLPALAAKLRGHGVGLFSPCDIQQVLPTGDRTQIEAATTELVESLRGGFIAKNYPDLHGIGVQPEWDAWAYNAFVRVGGRG
jgi:hypothetical protein